MDFRPESEETAPSLGASALFGGHHVDLTLGTKDTFLLPHLGHFNFSASCSDMVSMRSNFVPHFLQRYWNRHRLKSSK